MRVAKLFPVLVVASFGCSRRPMPTSTSGTDGAWLEASAPSVADVASFDAQGAPGSDAAPIVADAVVVADALSDVPSDVSVTPETLPAQRDVLSPDQSPDEPRADVSRSEMGGKDVASLDGGSVIEGTGQVACGGAVCTSSTGPCCPVTQTMSRIPLCSLSCAVPTITCDGPEDCAIDQVCCSVESVAGGFTGTVCVTASQCVKPSRVACHQSTDCPSQMRCGTPNPAPAAVFPFSEPDETWLVDYLVCAS